MSWLKPLEFDNSPPVHVPCNYNRKQVAYRGKLYRSFTEAAREIGVSKYRLEQMLGLRK